MDRVHLNEVVDIFGEMVGEELFAKEINSVGKSLGQLDVLAGVPD